MSVPISGNLFLLRTIFSYMFVTISGNIFLLRTIFTYVPAGHVINIFISNLAITDILVLSTTMPLKVSYFKNSHLLYLHTYLYAISCLCFINPIYLLAKPLQALLVNLTEISG